MTDAPASERRPVTRLPTYPSVPNCTHRGPAEACRREECPLHLRIDWDAVAREARLTRRFRETLVASGSRCAAQLAEEHGALGSEAVAWLVSDTGRPLTRQRVQQLVDAALIRLRRLYRETPDGDVLRRPDGSTPALVAIPRRCARCGDSIDGRPRQAVRCVPCAALVAREKAADSRRRNQP